MHCLPRIRWIRILLGLLAMFSLAVLCTCSYFQIWSFEDYRTYHEVSQYPMGEDLWFGRIKAGERLESFTAAHPPHHMLQLKDFTVLTYYSSWPLPPHSLPMESVSVTAKEGRLIEAAAGGCNWHRRFFVMSARDEADLSKEYRRYCDVRRDE